MGCSHWWCGWWSCWFGCLGRSSLHVQEEVRSGVRYAGLRLRETFGSNAWFFHTVQRYGLYGEHIFCSSSHYLLLALSVTTSLFFQDINACTDHHSQLLKF